MQGLSWNLRAPLGPIDSSLHFFPLMIPLTTICFQMGLLGLIIPLLHWVQLSLLSHGLHLYVFSNCGENLIVAKLTYTGKIAWLISVLSVITGNWQECLMDNMTKTSVRRIITVSVGSNCALQVSFWWGLYNKMNCSFKNNFSYCIASSNSIWLPSLTQSFVTGPFTACWASESGVGVS